MTLAGNFAAESLEASVTEPLAFTNGLPASSSATIVTNTGMPTGTALGSITASRVTTGAATTVTAAAPTMSPATPPRTVSVCEPGEAKVTRAIARPDVKVTVVGSVAAVSLEASVAVPV